MSAFRRPQNAFRFLSATLKNPLINLKSVIPGRIALMKESTPCSPLCGHRQFTSSVKPKEDKENSNSDVSANLDPFGLEEVTGSDEKSSVLVQGFYSGNEAERSSPPPFTAAQNNPPNDYQKENRLSEYDSWLRERVDTNQSYRSEGEGSSESIRQAHFGQIRVDSDNPVGRQRNYDRGSRRERVDEPGFRLSNKNMNRQREEWQSSLQPPREEITETIEADHTTRMRASDFLQQLKGFKDISTNDDRQQPGGGRTVIEKIMNPATPPSMDPNDAVNYNSAKEDPTMLDTNVIPKPFQMPDYNQITELDMWNILRKTIIFQNDFILAINKPYGIPVHSKAISCRHTIIQFLKKFADLLKVEEVFPLHRLDKETTGVLLFAKDKKIADVIKTQFAHRDINKTYLTVTKLCPKVREGTIKIPIGEGKIPGTTKFRRVLRPDLREYGIKPTTRECVEAVTHFKVLHSIKEAAFLEVEPETGVKHQIRVHLGMGLGCPVIGDHKYSHRDKLAPQRLHPFVLHKLKVKQSKVRDVPLHLHCSNVSFTLPKEYTNSTEPVYIHAKIPLFMKYTLRQLGLIA
ncbi:unnamed protein product [Orchesella dallaii]|uniref:Pseudouridylate synthase RPUSD4, mitochondrial n=1 Tax=Orchesella dallaii TaxID=48710 RepID=A0ABP1QHK8_9HEXA